jgi:hypothetical protein
MLRLMIGSDKRRSWQEMAPTEAEQGGEPDPGR